MMAAGRESTAARDRWLLVEENGDLWLIKREGHELHGRIVSREGLRANFLGFMMRWWRRTAGTRRASSWSGET